MNSAGSLTPTIMADVVQTVSVPQPLLEELRAVVSRICRHEMLEKTGVRPEAMATAEELESRIDLQPVLLAIVAGSIPSPEEMSPHTEDRSRTVSPISEEGASEEENFGRTSSLSHPPSGRFFAHFD